MKRIALTAALLLAGCGSSSSGDDMSAQSSTAAAKPAAAAGAPSGPAKASVTVDIKAFKYKPVTVIVKKGGRVRWTNSDDAAHTSTADDRSFDTETIERGKGKSVAMTTAGTFAYHCDFHPFMKGTVVVR